uniref:RING-type E3 ubiquitin transferase n=1 Tax=Davidia involucrata TaxID=16924 RepID=A0A5B7AHT8_DAVIN
MDQISSLTNQIANEEHFCSIYQSDFGHGMLPEGSTTYTPTAIQPSTEVLIISRRSSLPLSGATTRTIARGIAGTLNLLLSDAIEHIGNIISGSQNVSNSRTCITSSVNSILHLHFPPRISYALQYILQRSLLAAYGLTNHNGSSPSHLSICTASINENGSQNESDIDHMRWQYGESVLYMLRLADNSVEGLISLTILPAGNGVNFRLVPQEPEIPSFSQSLLFYVSDTLDHHRDMRLDVDNMSYEELLALEDHIGNVRTGLSEETIIKSIKHCKYFLFAEKNAEKDTCSICQEDYVEEDDLGTLNCGHWFHTECIKQWLGCKNLCPLCKSTALFTTGHTSPQIHSA